MKAIRTLTAAAALLLAVLPAAQAATQSYSFEGTLNAVQFFGSFSFDDTALVPFDGSITVAPVTNLSMSYGGTSYSLLDAWATPDVSYNAGAFLGLSYSNDAMTFVPGSVNASDAFVTDGLNSANVIYAAVPEPETYAMLLAGLGLIGGAVRRRQAQKA
jgi:hypothetical protein